MNVTGELRKLFTKLAWDGYQAERGDQKNDLVDYALDIASGDLWHDEVMSKATLDGLHESDAYLKQLVFNLIDWDEISNRAEELEYEEMGEADRAELASDLRANMQAYDAMYEQGAMA